jgi:hypothetical protein
LADPNGWRGIPKDRCSGHARRDLFEKFQPFSAQGVFGRSKAGVVSARMRHAFDEAGADRIGDSREHNWHGMRRLQQRG